MAYILLVDPDEVAQRAMKGILARGNHRFVAVGTAAEAWAFIQLNVKVDLVLIELALQGETGLSFIQRLKNDCFLKLLPVVVYTAHADRDSVKRILALHAQNFLIKPYHDDAVFSEIAKTAINPWRLQHFEEEKTFCQMMGLTIDGEHKMLDDLRMAIDVAQVSLIKWATGRVAKSAADELELLATKAETAGAWGVVACLRELIGFAQEENWPEFESHLPQLEFSSRLIFRHLNPSLSPDGFLTNQELNAETEAQARAVWTNAFSEGRCPVTNLAQLHREIENLAGCPVIDSVEASFQMTANGHPTSLGPLMDLVDKDPGLSAQMLIAVNQLKRPEKEDSSPIEDPRMAVGLLGELRLVAQARALLPAEERLMLAPPLSSWPHFWMLQLGTARIARFTCHYLELNSLEAPAYTAGLMHDLGKLLLLRLHPFAFQAILAHARQHDTKLADAERLFLGATTNEMAVHFADKHSLPKRFVNVIRWIDSPEKATHDAELVAIVSLARDLCRHNHVGFCGDGSRGVPIPLEDTAEWRVLRNSVFPSFDLKKFEAQVHAECRELRRELHGRLVNYAVA